MKLFPVIVLLLIIVGIGIYYSVPPTDDAKDEIVQESQTTETLPVPPPPAETPEVKHPVPEPQINADSITEKPKEETPVVVEQKQPLPSLAESDDIVKQLLNESVGDTLVSRVFRQTGIIQRFVATIDSLPRKKLAIKVRLTMPVAGTFLAQKDANNTITVAAKNAARYRPYMQLLSMLKTDQFVKWYTQFYPLIQEAYDELGYKERYFNDRFIEVIDHLLKTPKVVGPVQLVQPKVFYQYADPALEALSAGQKILLRIGSVNRAIVKARLIEIRNSLARS